MCYWLLRVWLVLHVFVLSSLHCLSVHFDVQKVVNGAKVVNWICVNFCHNLSVDDAHQFCNKLSNMCRTTGLVIFLIIFFDCVPPKVSWNAQSFHFDLQSFQAGNPKIFSIRPDQAEAGLRRICLEERKVQKIDLLLALLPDKNGSLYGYISYHKLESFSDFIITYHMPDVILYDRWY